MLYPSAVSFPIKIHLSVQGHLDQLLSSIEVRHTDCMCLWQNFKMQVKLSRENMIEKRLFQSLLSFTLAFLNIFLIFKNI